MPRYEVTLQVSQYELMVVEAETEQAARDNALLRAERIYMGYVTVDEVEEIENDPLPDAWRD
jgi:hypothetical protein